VAPLELISSILFGLAVSADGFAAGMAYGVKKIKIPIFSLLVIALASALAVSISMFCGRGLAMGLSPELASRLGALTILVLGSYFVLQALGEKISTIDTEAEQPIISVSIKPLGIIVQILKEPARADFDCSGIISAREAFFLGLALALDAMGVGWSGSPIPKFIMSIPFSRASSIFFSILANRYGGKLCIALFSIILVLL
jgi:putative sporulation protein YtaF